MKIITLSTILILILSCARNNDLEQKIQDLETKNRECVESWAIRMHELNDADEEEQIKWIKDNRHNLFCYEKDGTVGQDSNEESFLDSIFEKTCTDFHTVSVNELNNRESLISFLYLSNDAEDHDANQILKIIQSYTNDINFDPSIAHIYLSWLLEEKDFEHEDLLPLLIRFYEKESDNALPAYYLSYYYINKDQPEKAMQYLIEGNKRERYDRYLKDKKEAIYKTLSKKNNDKLCIHSAVIGVYFQDFFVRDFSKKLTNLGNNELAANEIYKMGLKMEKNSESLIGMMVSFGIQSDGTNLIKDKNPDIHYEVLSRSDEFRQFSGKCSENIFYKQITEETMRKYWENLYNYGEIYACEAALNE